MLKSFKCTFNELVNEIIEVYKVEMKAFLLLYLLLKKETKRRQDIMNRKGLKLQIIVGGIFLAALGYGISTISLIGHRPVEIFITEGLAILALGVTFVYSLFANRKSSTLKKLAVINIILLVMYGITELVCNQNYQAKVNSISVEEVDLSAISDGIYIGECSVDYIRAKVEVEVNEHQIVNIKLLEHINERGEKAETIIDTIIEQQSIDVDAVSSATNSSKVIKQAVENALLKGVK